jgi:hypothetical protein
MFVVRGHGGAAPPPAAGGGGGGGDADSPAPPEHKFAAQT